MRYLLLADTHSNLPALETVMACAPKEDFDRVICLGDVVGYNPYPNECLCLAEGYADVIVPGNHDLMVYNYYCFSHGMESSAIKTDFSMSYHAHRAAEWNAAQLTAKSFMILEKIVRQDYSFKEEGLLFTHSTPSNPEWMHYVRDCDSFHGNFIQHPEISSSLAFVGHAHIPQVYGASRNKWGFWKDAGGRIVFVEADEKVSGLKKLKKNYPELFAKQEEKGGPILKKIDLSRHEKALVVVPSVGQPRDGLKYTGWAEYDSGTKKVKLLRVPYRMRELLDTVKESAETGLPDYSDRLKNGY